MKKKIMLFFLTALTVLTFTACQKDSQPAEYDLSFDISAGETLKSTEAITCFEQPADYVKVTISGIVYKLDVFYIDNKPITTTIKLPEGNYSIQEFLLYNDNGTPTDEIDDWLMAATPHAGSTYAWAVTNTVIQNFNISQFAKNRFSIEVVCYEADHYDDFGFFVLYNGTSRCNSRIILW